LYLKDDREKRSRGRGILLHLLPCVCAAHLLVACAGLNEFPSADFDGADYWDSGLVYHRHIDVAMLSGDLSTPELFLSGLISAVAASANALYFIDEGAGQLVQYDFTTMAARPLISLQGPFTPGLYAGLDGNVYVIDRGNNRLLIYDTVVADVRFLPLGSIRGNPLDVAVVGDGQWVFVLDGLQGNIATLDMFGGVTQIMRPELPTSMSFIAPRAIAAGGHGLLILDGGADEVIEFDFDGNPVGVYGADDLLNPAALAADACGRFFVADDQGLYLGFADMSLPGRYVTVPELAGSLITDLWSDDVFLFAATRADGIHMLLIDPPCGAP